MNAQATVTSGTKAPANAPILQVKAAVGGAGRVPSEAAAAASTETAQAESGAGPTPAFLDPGQRRAMIAEAAYYRAERRGFEPGRELEDWFLAEGEIDALPTLGESGGISLP